MNEIPFALLRWIKAQQEAELRHREAVVAKNWREDDQYMRFLSFLIREWKLLKIKDKQIVCNFVKWHDEKRNFTPAQRSCMAALVLKYELVVDVA